MLVLCISDHFADYIHSMFQVPVVGYHKHVARSIKQWRSPSISPVIETNLHLIFTILRCCFGFILPL